jgi:hypothetical protein
MRSPRSIAVFRRRRSCRIGGAGRDSLPEPLCSFKAYPDKKVIRKAALRRGPGKALCFKLAAAPDGR